MRQDIQPGGYMPSMWPPAAVRNMGIYLLASKGSGKSRLLGRWIAIQDVLAGIPQVLVDPVGGAIDNFLDAVARLPSPLQAEIRPRIVYIDMGHPAAVVPMPLYYRQSPDESLYRIAQRPLDTWRMLDPNLQGASIEGWNALAQCGTHVGMALAALDGQIVDAQTLFQRPKSWIARLQAACSRFPDLAPSVHWLTQELPALKPDLRARQTSAFLRKIAIFQLDPWAQAVFAARHRSWSWEDVVANRQTVLLDLRRIHTGELQRFTFLWLLQSLLAFIRHRGRGDHTPMGFIIDEVSIMSMLDMQSDSQLFAGLLDNLLNVWARQGQIWVTLAHQELWQVSPLLFKTLMGCGTRIVGRTSDADAALTLARALIPADPRRVKRYEPRYDGRGELLDQRPINWTLDEQHFQASQLYQKLGAFRFLYRTVGGEGGRDLPLRPLDLRNLEPGCFPNDAMLALLRERLHQRTSTPIADLLAAPDFSLPEPAQEVKPALRSATVTETRVDPDGYLIEESHDGDST